MKLFFGEIILWWLFDNDYNDYNALELLTL